LLEKIQDLVIQKHQLSFSKIRRYFIMLAKGLNVIHKQGISHLDISCENILVTSKDELKICDFGQAQMKRIIKDEDLKRGKPKYMSPEVYNLRRYDGFKADVWSLGVVLWVMITGGLLYRKPTILDKRFSLLEEGEEGIERLLQVDGIQDINPTLIHLFSRMLDVNPITRYVIEDVLSHPWLNDPKSKTEEVSEEKHK